LKAIYPSLTKLDILENDYSFYDDFDMIAESLWDIMVINSLKWKGLDISKIENKRYGFAIESVSSESDLILVKMKDTKERYCFVQFIGDRNVSDELFNSVEILGTDKKIIRKPLDKIAEFYVGK
jgi:hypothetical protein